MPALSTSWIHENLGNYQKTTYHIETPSTTSASPTLKRLRHISLEQDTPKKKRKMDEDEDSMGNLKDFVTYDDDNESDHDKIETDEHPESKWKNPELEDEYRDFCRTLAPEEQQHLCELEQELTQCMRETLKPLKYQILTTQAPLSIKMIMMGKLNKLLTYDKSTNDYTFELSTLQQLLQIPWGIYAELPINKNNCQSEIQTYLSQAMQFLNSVTYGQAHAKSQLLLELSRYLVNPSGQGFILGIKGPPGSGKTTLISKGLAHLLNRPFYRIDLGGAKHSDCLFGSRKVFDRSDVGDLVKIVTDTHCMNPIIFFDELDKVSMSDYGQELIDALNDLTDTTRNHAITDQYLGVPLDLSHAIFVFAYNSSDHLQETLKSRIHEIEIEPYSLTDKIRMAQQFFIPASCQKIGLESSLFHFNEDALKTIITRYTRQEAGVREMGRKIDEIILKINWIQLTDHGSSELINCYSHHHDQISVPIVDHQYQITPKIVNRLLS